MNLIRQNVFHIFTRALFTGMLVHSWYNPDALGWTILFLLINLNAVLFILSRPRAMIAWVTILVGILGLLMSTPQLVSIGIDHMGGKPDLPKDSAETIRSAIYFTVSALFSFLQIHRIISIR